METSCVNPQAQILGGTGGEGGSSPETEAAGWQRYSIRAG